MHKNLSQSPRILVCDPRLTIARSTEGWWAKLVNAGHAFSPSSLTQCTLLIPFWNKYPFPKFSRSNLTLCLLLMPFRKKCPAANCNGGVQFNNITYNSYRISYYAPNFIHVDWVLSVVIESIDIDCSNMVDRGRYLCLIDLIVDDISVWLTV